MSTNLGSIDLKVVLALQILMAKLNSVQRSTNLLDVSGPSHSLPNVVLTLQSSAAPLR